MRRDERITRIFLEERKEWKDNCLAPDKNIINLVWAIDKSLLKGDKKIKNIDDFKYVYDNLIINNEIINCDNFYEYDEDCITKKITPSTISKIKKGDKAVLLNYYEPNGELKDCVFVFNYDFKSHLNVIYDKFLKVNKIKELKK